MYKPAAISGVIFACSAVILGAFGAHYLKTIFTPDLQSSFDTGVRYQFYHALALLLVGLTRFAQPQAPVWPTRLWIAGILLFSGSIYILCWLKSTAHIGLGGLGILTPIGGLLFIAGWLGLLISWMKRS